MLCCTIPPFADVSHRLFNPVPPEPRLSSETSQKPLFRWLGTPANDKRLLQFETGHMMPVEDIIREALNWLDRYLGPVEEKR